MPSTAPRDTTPDSILEFILNNIPIGILYCDADSKVRFINRTYAEYLGVERRDIMGRPVTDFIPDSRLNIVMETGQSELGDKCSIDHKGGKKTLVVNRIPARGEGGRVIGAVSQTLFADPDELKRVAQRVVHLEKKVAVSRLKIRSALSAKYSLSDIRGQSAAMAQARELAGRYAKTDSPVLVVGPTGTGKELFAHSIHQESNRAEGPFVSINCAAIPPDLSESELFGYAPGAFTGARKEGKIGYIELADKGTLFLDEIGDMPAMLQVKLLRVLEEKVVYRLGETDPHPVDFRLVVATNKPLKEQIRVRKFREDLYYRLSTMTIVIPPLRERTEDLPILVRHMLERLGRPTVKCSNGAMDAIIGFDWPGNVRQLKNVLERALSTCKGDLIEWADLPPDLAGARAPGVAPRAERERVPLSQFRSENEKSLILDTLAEQNWNVVKSARALNISRATLYEKLKKHQISRHAAPVIAP